MRCFIALLISLIVLVLQGCAGTETFSHSARAGDTVALAVGWRQNLSKSNITVEFWCGNPGNQTLIAAYGPADPAIRAVTNLYPDPLSSLLVSPQVGEDLSPSAQVYSDIMKNNFTGGDSDLSQTVVFVDLPTTLPEGVCRIHVAGGGYSDSPAIRIDILPGTGSSQTFNTEGGGLNQAQLESLERVSNYTVAFAASSGVVPYAIELDLVHDPDRDSGGTGKAYVVNTRGDLKNITWHDDGANLKVILTPADNQPPGSLLDYKFYVVGGVTNLAVNGIQAFDSQGNYLSGITPVLSVNP